MYLDSHISYIFQVPLKELLNESEEEISKALSKKIALEDTLEQVSVEHVMQPSVECDL